MKTQLHHQKGQMLNNLLLVAASVYPVAALIIYYMSAKNGIKLNYFYFLSFFIEVSLTLGLLFAIFRNKWVGGFLLCGALFFFGISMCYSIDWIGNDKPKLNSVIECLFVSAAMSNIYLFWEWIKHYFIKLLWSGLFRR